jgi:4-hydroxybenzoate polyprenyltransferase
MSHTDIKTQGWISKFPEAWQPYAILMRLDRPIGWWLLLLPGLWAIVMGANGATGMVAYDIRLMIFFLFGAIIMRGAGCIINDLWDRDLDKQVERTKNRPLASGEVPIYAACILLFFLIFTALMIALQMSFLTVKLGFLALIFVAVYPLMKRITWWPQAFLGLTFNFGALMGFSAATHHLNSFEPFILYAAGFFWTLGYDTIYAHQDKADDELVGIKSTALLLGSRSKFWVGVFYMIALLLIGFAAYLAGAGIIGLGLLSLPAIHLIRQINDWEPDDPQNSLFIFKSNRNFGLLVLFAFAFINISPMIEEYSGFSIPHIGF